MLTPLFFLQPVNVKKSETLAKIANIHEENLHIFWRTWRILIKFARKISLMIILKFTKNQGLTLSLENTILEKPKFGSNWTPSPSFFSIKSFVWLCFWNYFLPLYIIPLESFTLCVFFLSKVSKNRFCVLKNFSYVLNHTYVLGPVIWRKCTPCSILIVKIIKRESNLDPRSIRFQPPFLKMKKFHSTTPQIRTEE